MERLETLLRTSKHRLTAPRKQVFTALKKAQQPLSLQQLTRSVPAIDRTSLYRTLELFVQLSIVRVIHTGWKKQYELADPFKPHHHHLQCTRCKELIEVKNPQLEQLIDRIVREHHYALTNHHFELEGLCQNCRN
jgi:Fe2+ or Zn2+ uptake regulation protein